MSEFDACYARKRTTAREAAGKVRSSDTLVHGMAVGEPPALLSAVADRLRAGDLKDLRIYTLSAMEHANRTVLAPDLADCVQAHSWFVSSRDRHLVQVGLSWYVPNYFHQIPRICTEFMSIDVVLAAVSPMDRAGYFSFGVSNDFITTAARHCKTLIVEVNPRMPRVFGDSFLHVSEVDAIVENDAPLQELAPPDPKPEDEAIGRAVAGMVPDGATIQLGAGGIPNALAVFLRDHRDLGIHTELLCDGMVDLIEAGVVNGKRKTIHPRKSLFTLARGTRRLYEFMDGNPGLESYPVSYINDPAVIARNDRMVSINSVLEVDLLGQCNAEYLGGSQFSGTGGQVDFVRGAFQAREGKSILAFYATARDGEISRIVPRFESGTVITTPRMDTHYLVTEYGVANLKGKSTRERALSIIGLAHPRFRDDLLREAEAMYIL